jgi:hypothetical protein
MWPSGRWSRAVSSAASPMWPAGEVASRYWICLTGRAQGAMWWGAAPSRWRICLAGREQGAMWWRAAPSRWRICLAGREQGAMWWRAAPSRWRVFLALPVAIGSQKQPDGGNCQTGGEAVRKGYRVTGVSEHDRHTVRDRSLDGWGSSSSFNLFRPLNLLTAYPAASDPRPPWTPFNAVDAGKIPFPAESPFPDPSG